MKWAFTERSSLSPRLYYALTGQNTGNGVDYSTGQVGGGLQTQLALGDSWLLSLEAFTLNLSSPVIKEHAGAKLSLMYGDSLTMKGWELSVQFQSIKVEDSVGLEREFDHTFASLLRSF